MKWADPASIRPFQGTLLISQTRDVHQESLRLLAALRESRDKQRAGAATEPLWVESLPPNKPCAT